MLIDWFTIVAQIINFLILVGLLKYFLYGRILKAMDEREKKIASNWLEAQEQAAKAGQEADAYRQKVQELEEQRNEILVEAKHGADAQRIQLLQEARKEVDATRVKWYESVGQEKTAFLQDLRRRTISQVYGVARHALKELANTDLEEHLTDVFIERIQRSEPDTWIPLKGFLEEAHKTIIVKSAFAISLEKQNKITQALRAHLPKDVQIDFKIVRDMVGGIEVKAPGYTIAWSFDRFLEALEENVSQALEEDTQKTGRTGKPTEEEGENI